MIINRENLAWAAGFFDGEGHVRASLQPNGRVSSPSISIEQTKSPNLLKKFNHATGNLGAIAGPYKITNPNGNPHWRLNIHGFEKIQAILAMLWPWLGRIKKEQFKLAIVTWNAREGRRYKP